MKEKGCVLEGVLLHVQSQLLCIYYIVYIFSLIFIREKEGRRRRRKKKNLFKNVLPIRRFESLKTGISLCIFLLDGAPITISFFLHSLFLRVLFVKNFLGLYWMGSIKRAGEWVGRSLVNGDVILVRNAIQWRNSAGQTTDATVFLLLFISLLCPCVCVIFSVSSFLFR